MNTVRYLYALIRWWLQIAYRRMPWVVYQGGRRSDWRPVRCEKCGWRGPERWCHHLYYDDHHGDCYPVDECPRCGVEELGETMFFKPSLRPHRKVVRQMEACLRRLQAEKRKSS